MSEVHSFQAEVTQVLDLVIHSLYSHKEVFLRELVSNAADALDKLRFRAITEPDLLKDDAALEIRIVPDKAAGTLTVEDTGVGMTHDELVKNLGTIAHSGAREFFEQMASAGKKDAALIGQFGVGFYSAFLVAREVEVTSRAAGAGAAFRWRSDAKSTFTIEPAEREARGTRVVLHLKDDQKEFLEPYRIRELVARYSDYVNLPIKLGDPNKDPSAFETVNRATALWQRPRGEITEAQARELYKHLIHDVEDPAAWAHVKAEGTHEFAALLFVPKTPPFELGLGPRQGSGYAPDERGLRLYVKRVLVMERCQDLLPPWLRFVRGVVDSDDLPLNVSRETLQDSSVVRAIRKQVVRKVVDVLTEMATNDAETYATFWKAFGPVVKEGLAIDPEHKDRIVPLLRFESTHEEGALTSLADYAARMKPEQKAIYFALGSSRRALAGSPHLEALARRGFEVLLLTDPVDEWAAPALGEFEGKALVSATAAGLDLEPTEEEKKAAEESATALGPLLDRAREVLGDRVKEVRVSTRLVGSPVCLVLPEGAPTPLMERLLRDRGAKLPETKPILEVNPEHPVIEVLRAMHATDPASARAADWIELLYDQAKVAEGKSPDDPAQFARRITSLLVELSGAGG